MSSSFRENSGMIKLAKINWNVLVSMWQSIMRKRNVRIIILLIPVTFYSCACLALIIFFYAASVLDFISYAIASLVNSLSSFAEEISKTNYGTISIILYPPVVFLVGILMVVAIILPKAAQMKKNIPKADTIEEVDAV